MGCCTALDVEHACTIWNECEAGLQRIFVLRFEKELRTRQGDDDKQQG